MDWPQSVQCIGSGQVEESPRRGIFGGESGDYRCRARPAVRTREARLRRRPRVVGPVRQYSHLPAAALLLAEGRTLPALDVGGGIEVAATRRTLLRADLGDPVLRYPAPVFDHDRAIRRRPFLGHDPRIAVAAGLRF